MPIRRIPAPGSPPPADPKPLLAEGALASEPTPSQPASIEISAPDQPSPGYDVGFCKTPKHSRFKPGQSGNPKGRPKAAKGLKTITRELLTEKVSVRTAKGETKISRIQAVFLKLHEQAMKGNPRALAELLRLYSLAVPDSAPVSGETSFAELGAADLQIIEELKTLFSDGGEA